MSKKDMVYHIGVDMSANIGDVESKFNKLKSTLASVSLPSSMKKELTETFTRASQELEDFITLQKQSGHTEADVKKINQAYKSVTDSIDILSRKVAGIESLDASKLLPKELNGQIKELNKEIARLSDLSKGQDSVQIREATDAYTVQEQKVAELNKKLKEQEESQTKLAGVKDTTADRAAEAKKHYDELSDTQDKLKTKIGDMTNDDYNKSLEKTTKYHDDLNAKIAKEAELTEKIDALNEKIERKKARRKNTKEGTKERKDLDLDIEFAEKDRDKLVKERGQVRRSKTNLEKSEPEIKSAEKMQKQYEEYTKAAQAVKEFETEVDKTAKTSENAARNYERATATLAKSQSNYDAAQKELDELSQDLKELEDASGNLDAPLQKVRVALANLKGVDISEIPSDIGQLQGVLDNLVNDQMNRVQTEIRELKTDLDSTDDSTERLGNDLRDNFTKTAESMFSAQKQMEQLSQSMLHFFSLTNGWQLLKRAIREAFETVKELDAAMTEIAVVSDYTVDEIWAMREQYSAAATQMGAKTIDLVNATKLYVQQGLSLNEAMEVGIETTKMARIANLDGAEATNLMTAALRGFNMEMEEANRVNDTYSQLAAKSAADTQEIAVAMSKTASIAANAGSSFENMSAFLTQIIETTREAPETAGTAMKTIIARFQELKKPMSEIGEVDGEIVDANGIETALRSAGVQLRDTNGEFRDFDEVIIELAGKWDGLDVMTQRYIATMAAGSRQQSRFIALMSDNARLTELVGYANNSAGAANQQYEKTLESLEAKLNKLKNAVDIFWTNLANNKIIKFAVDLLTKVIETVNSLTSAFTQSKNGFINLVGSLLQIGMIAGAFKLQQNAILGIFSKISVAATSGGAQAGTSWTQGFAQSIKANGGIIGAVKALFSKLRTQAVAFGKDFKKAFSMAGKGLSAAAVNKNDLDILQRMTEATKQYNAATIKSADVTKSHKALQDMYASSLSLSNKQKRVYTTLTSYGVTADVAAKAALDGLNDEKIKEILLDQKNNNLSDEEIQNRLQEAAATRAQTFEQRKLNAEKMTAGTKLGGLIQGLFGFTSASRSAGAQTAGFANSTSLLGKAMTALPIGWILVAIGAIIGIAKIVQGFIETTEEELEQINKSIEETSSVLSDAQSELSDLKSSKTDLEELNDSFEGLVRGSQEWREKLFEVNQQVLDLINKYPELAQYVSRGAEGQLTITETGWDQAIEAKQRTITNSQSTIQNLRVRQAEIENDKMAAQAQHTNSKMYAMGAAGGVVGMSLAIPVIGPVLLGITAAVEGLQHLFTGKGLFTTIGESIAEKQSGATQEEWEEIMNLAGERGVNGNDVEGLQQIFLEVTGSMSGFDQFLDSVVTMGGDFSELSAEIYKNKEAQEAQRDAIIESVMAMNPDIAEDKYAEQARTMADMRFDKDVTKKELEKELGNMYDHNDGKIEEDLKKEYAAVTGMTLDEVNAKLKDESLSEDTMAEQVYTERQNQKMAKDMNKTVEEFRNLGNILDDNQMSMLTNIFSDEGQNLKATQLQEIMAQLGPIDSVSEENVNNFLAQYKTSLSELGFTLSDFQELVKNAQKGYTGAYSKADALGADFGVEARLNVKALSNAIGDELTVSQTQAYANLLTEVEKRDGDTDLFSNLFEQMASQVSEEDRDTFMSALLGTDWSSDASIEAFIEQMTDLGYNFEHVAHDQGVAANAIQDVNFASIAEQILIVKEGLGNYSNDESYAFSEEEYEAFKKYTSEEDWTKIETGENKDKYSYTGSLSAYELRKKVTADTPDFQLLISDVIESQAKQNTLNAAGGHKAYTEVRDFLNQYSGIRKGLWDSLVLNPVKKEQEYWGKTDSGKYAGRYSSYTAPEKAVPGIEKIFGQNFDKTNWTAPALPSDQKQTELKSYTFLDYWESEEEKRNSSFEFQRYKNSGRINLADSVEWYATMYNEGYHAQDEKAMDKELAQWDRFEGYLKSYTNWLDEQLAPYEQRKQELMALGADDNDSVNKQKKAAEDALKVELEPKSLSKIFAAQELGASLTLVQGLTQVEGIIDQKVQDSQVKMLYSAVISQGGQAGLTEDILSKLKEERENAVWEELDLNETLIDAIEEVDEITMGQILNEKFTTAIEKIDIYGKLTSAEAKERTVKKMVSDALPTNIATQIIEAYTVTDGNGDKQLRSDDLYSWLSTLLYGDFNSYKEVFQATNFSVSADNSLRGWGQEEQVAALRDGGFLKTDLMKVEGDAAKLIGHYILDAQGNIINVTEEYQQQMVDGTYSVLSQYTEEEYAAIVDQQQEQWTHSYDWLYNLQKQMNKELRERNKLEAEENRILEDRETTVEGLLDNLNAQTQSLMQSLNQNALLKEKRTQEKDLWMNEAERLGLKDYVWMDKNGVIQMDYEKVDALKDSAQGETFSQFLEEGEFLQEEFEMIEDNQEEYTDALNEIKKKYFEDAVNLEEELIDAIYELREREIERLKDINKAITDGNSKMLDRISEQISEMRTTREDEESLNEITEMEQRLALMRTDTSGTNALDILSLEKELEQARQDYQDSQVDRAIDEMTKQNEKAAEQRQMQIDLMDEQLKADKDYGVIAQQVNNLLSKALTSNETTNISEILTSVSNKDALGNFGKDSFEQSLEDKVTKGIVGAIKSGAPELGERVKFTTADGQEIEGVGLADGSVVDKKGNVYTNVYGEADEKGNRTYKQHQTGDTYSKTEWDKLTSVNPDTLKIGSADMVQVTGATVTVTGDQGPLESESSDNQIRDAQNILYSARHSYAGGLFQDYDNVGVSTKQVLTQANRASADLKLGISFKSLEDVAYAIANGEIPRDKEQDFLYLIDTRLGTRPTQYDHLIPYATGGLADFTGPAWLDGTKSRPEYVLSAVQTQGFLSLVDILDNFDADKTKKGSGDNYYDVHIEVDEISNDYDVEQLMDKMKRIIADDAMYRNVNAVDLGRR